MVRSFCKSVFALFFITVAALAPFAHSADPPQPIKQKSSITISKDTTRITEPVDDEGYVDYLAAINEQASRGVTPKNNAAVLLWQALGAKPLADWKPEPRAKVFRMLGMGEPEKDAAQYVSLEDFVAKVEHDLSAAGKLSSEMHDRLDAAATNPWNTDA